MAEVVAQPAPTQPTKGKKKVAKEEGE